MARRKNKAEISPAYEGGMYSSAENTIGVASHNFRAHPDQATKTVAYDFTIHLIPKDKWEENGITKENTLEFLNSSFERCKQELIKVVFPE